MPRVSLTPDLNPSDVSKTLDHNSPHTAGHLNRIAGELVGGNRVLSGLAIVQTGVGLIEIMPGSFIANGVIVTLKRPLEVSYAELLESDMLPRSDGRTRSLLLYGYCEDAALTSEVAFGVVADDDVAEVTGDGFVHIAARLSKDEREAEPDAGRWAKIYGFSAEDLARDLREGVQVLASVPFAGEDGQQFTNPVIPSAYFVSDEQLLVFADRFLLPSDRMASGRPVRYGRADVRGIKETLGSMTAFGYDGKYGANYSLLTAKWGFVVSRDIAWHEAWTAPGSPAANHTVPEYLPGSGRIVVFENGLPLSPSEVTEVDSTTISCAWTAAAHYDVVCFKDVVFRETHTIEAADLAGGASFDIVFRDHLADPARHTILTFVRVTSPGGAEADGGYIQMGRAGTATRASQAVKIAGGSRLTDAGTLRLYGIEMIAGASIDVTVLCVRGSAQVGVGELSSSTTTYKSFRKVMRAVAGTPGESQFRAGPNLDGFVTETPGAVTAVSVAIHDVNGSDQWAPHSMPLPANFFSEYTLQFPSDFQNEATPTTAPRRISASTAVAYQAVSGHGGRSYGVATLSVPGGVSALKAGDDVRMVAGRLIEGLPRFRPGSLRLALSFLRGPSQHAHGATIEDGGMRLLIPDVDYVEASETSIILKAHTVPGQYLEISA